MLKNKIYKYLSNEILKSFITILFTFTAIAWVARAVNFLDFMVADGFSASVYFKYSVLNITTIMTRFIPLAFLLSLIFSVVKFEKQQELLILWTSGLNKIKIANIFILIAFFLTIFQLILSLFINPYLLNKSRSLLTNTDEFEIGTILKSNDFSDNFKGITFYISKKNTDNELIDIFIKDTSGSLGSIIGELDESKNLTILAKKGFVSNNKLVLFDGMMQSLNKKNEFKNIQFERTELSLFDLSTRIIKKPKVQETLSSTLLECVLNKNNNLKINNCTEENYKSVAVENLSRRLGVPLYIPLISIIVSFLLIYKKEKRFIFLKKYILFILSFFMLVFAEILLKYTGYSLSITISYFILPVVMSAILYIYLIKKITSEKQL